ncbi:DUF6968 family protein [Methylobacterium sp. J-076]|uniref:DUF6968 family protein n=1 Tax=Methylobacterium sp. J-076 TaxID=2836655 RepID=UPI001FBB33E3|nr:hypothetical protein [Methylobacterium sp. J-076]MCJ2011165.1 hypothetical protein [Methylobacterium sp. J-076]
MLIADRILTAQLRNSAKQVPISIYAPRFADGMNICEYVIGWPEGERRSFGAGVDSVQALHSALLSIGIELYASAYHKSGILSWEKSGEGYGFPVPKNARELLVGNDKVFDG